MGSEEAYLFQAWRSRGGVVGRQVNQALRGVVNPSLDGSIIGRFVMPPDPARAGGHRHISDRSRNLPGHLQRLIKISDDIIDMFDAHREADIATGHASSNLIFRRELAVGGAGRMDRKGPRVADIRHMIEQLQRVDEFPPGVAAGFQFKTHKST